MSELPEPTEKQGQYLSFIYYYTKLHRKPPAETDFQKYFRTAPPTCHSMIKGLEALGFIQKTPGAPRSIELVIPRDRIPDLE